jgi:hypothetical protein
VRPHSFFERLRNRQFVLRLQLLIQTNSNRLRVPLQNRPILDSLKVLPRGYSAAAASDSFGFLSAADSMKSEMRGTISDLNREPLKTP